MESFSNVVEEKTKAYKHKLATEHAHIFLSTIGLWYSNYFTTAENKAFR